MMPALQTPVQGTVLAIPGFVPLWLCSTADACAIYLFPVAVTLTLLHHGHGAAALGLALAAKTFGYLLAAIPGGIAADHFSRSNIISIACLFRVLSTSLLLFFVDGPVWLMAVCMFVTGASEGVLRPAHMALIGDLIPESEHQSVIALTTIAFRVSMVLAPGAATALTLCSGPRTVFLIAIFLWLCAGIVVRKLPCSTAFYKKNSHTQNTREPVYARLLAGIRGAREQLWFTTGLASLTVAIGALDASQMILLPLTSRNRFGTESVYAAALTAFALGALAGGAIMLRWRPHHPGLIAMIGIALIGGIPFALAFSTYEWPVYAANFAAGVGMEIFNVAWFAAIQREFAPDVRARISALDFLVSSAISPLSLVFTPSLVTAIGMQPVLIGMGTVVSIACFGALTVPGMTRFHTTHMVTTD